MGDVSLTDEDYAAIEGCLAASVQGTFFEEWEFQTLFGLARPDVAAVLAEPERIRSIDEVAKLAIQNSFANLIGYPHGKDGELLTYVQQNRDQLESLFHKWAAAMTSRAVDE